MKIESIPEHVLSNIRNRGFSDEHISSLTAREIFTAHCQWMGLFGYSDLYDLARKLAEIERAEAE